MFCSFKFFIESVVYTVLNEELVNKLSSIIENSEQKNIGRETEKPSTLTNFIKLEPDILQE